MRVMQRVVLFDYCDNEGFGLPPPLSQRVHDEKVSFVQGDAEARGRMWTGWCQVSDQS